MLAFMICTLTRSVFWDVVAGPNPELNSSLLLIAGAILAVWAVSFAVIKAVRKKNVGK